jgi:excisionase family DNA binding protein
MNTPMADSLDKLLTVEEVMATLRISRPTLYRLLKSEKLIPVRIGKRTLFDLKDIRAFVEASKGRAEIPKPEKYLKKRKQSDTHRNRKTKIESLCNEQIIETITEKPHQSKPVKPEIPEPHDGQGRLL